MIEQIERLRLLDHLQAQQPYTEALVSLFGSVYGFHGAFLNTAAHESLKSQGMDLISDDSLRNLLDYRLQQIQQVHVPACEFASRDMDQLAKEIAAHNQ